MTAPCYQNGAPMPSVSRIFIHPVKSGRAVEVDSARVVARGLEHDRRWMIVDERGEFLTQREIPRMALLSAELTDDGIVLGFPDMLRLAVAAARAGPLRDVVVWDDHLEAASAGPAAAEWLASALGRPADLVFMPDAAERLAPAKHDPSASLVSFADAFPLLLLSAGSVRDLSDRVGRPLDVRRFRPSIVVDGCDPFAEDGWRTISVGALELRVAKPCSRCVIVNVDPETGEPSREPLATLATYRSQEHRILFGQNAVVVSSPPHPWIHVGDEVRVLERC